jgi:hypothetical protein
VQVGPAASCDCVSRSQVRDNHFLDWIQV